MNSLKLHLSHLNYNYSQIQKQLNPKTQIVAVVKAGAYGSALEAFQRQLKVSDCIGKVLMPFLLLFLGNLSEDKTP